MPCTPFEARRLVLIEGHAPVCPPEGLDARDASKSTVPLNLPQIETKSPRGLIHIEAISA